MTITELPKASVRRPDVADLQMTMHAVHGIFATMGMLHQTTELSPEQRRDVVADLIIAGERLANDVLERL